MIGGWEDIRAEVLRRIRARDWPPGAMIPTEEELATEFGVARATVNRALRELAVAGVLERRRKAGTRVAALPIRKATLDIPVIRQEVEARGQTHSFRLLVQTEGTPPVPVASRLGLGPSQRMIYLETLHLADGILRAKRVVVTVPAPQVAGLLGQDHPLARCPDGLLQTADRSPPTSGRCP